MAQQGMGRGFIEGDRVYGRVVRVQGSSSFPSTRGKLASWARGGRWQFGQNQWQENALYVVPADVPDSGVERCLHVSGDLAGAVREGNVIDARVRSRAGRLEVREIINVSTNADVTPTSGISSVWAVVALVVVIVLVAALAWGISSGALATVVLNLFGTLLVVVLEMIAAVTVELLPLIVVVALVVALFRLLCGR